MVAAPGIKERRKANGGARPCARRRRKGRHGAGAKEEAGGRSDGFGVALGDSRRVAARGTARGERGRRWRKTEPRQGEQLEDVGEGFRLGAHWQEEMTPGVILWCEREGLRGVRPGFPKAAANRDRRGIRKYGDRAGRHGQVLRRGGDDRRSDKEGEGRGEDGTTRR